MTVGHECTLGFMQPYFLPYPGYFELIARSDVWLVFDDAQMIRRGWVNRNRILHPEQGWQYARVPVVKHAREAKISEVRIADANWGERLIAQLAHYRDAPGYEGCVRILNRVMAAKHERLLDVNLGLLAGFCEWLGIRFEPRLHSELDYDRSAVQGPGDWALEASRALGATRYVNPPGGRELFDAARFRAAGVQLEILEPDATPYEQGSRPYEPGLSILDKMMFCGTPSTARARQRPDAGRAA